MNYNLNTVAESVADQMTKTFGGKFEAHDLEERSIELSLDGEKYAGGSLYIDDNDHLIVASTTPQQDLGDVKELDKVLETISKLK